MKVVYAAILGIVTSIAVFAFAQWAMRPEDTVNKSAALGWIAMIGFSVIMGFLIFARATNLGRKGGLLPPKGQ
jgi:hypothetical protein